MLALQAMLLSVLLAIKRPRTQSNIFLALVVFFFALMAFNIALVNVLITYDVFYIFRYFQLELLLGVGPALYFYTKSITDKEFKFTKKQFIHFVPVILEFIFYRTAFYRLGADGMYQTPHHPYTKFYLAEQWIGILSITIYTILALKIQLSYQKWLKQNYSNLEHRSLNWLKIPVIIYAAFWIGWQILTEIDRFAFDRELKEIYFLPSFLALAAVSCWIGFKGYISAQLDVSGYSERQLKQEEESVDVELTQKVEALMQTEEPYLDPDLDLTKLSLLLEMNPKQVSNIINRSFSKNFYEYVNYYRVEAFKNRLIEPEADRLTLLGHAFDCGFKSKSTFNDVFKKNTGKTPSEYLKQLKKESERTQSVA